MTKANYSLTATPFERIAGGKGFRVTEEGKGNAIRLRGTSYAQAVKNSTAWRNNNVAQSAATRKSEQPKNNTINASEYENRIKNLGITASADSSKKASEVGKPKAVKLKQNAFQMLSGIGIVMASQPVSKTVQETQQMPKPNLEPVETATIQSNVVPEKPSSNLEQVIRTVTTSPVTEEKKGDQKMDVSEYMEEKRALLPKDLDAALSANAKKAEAIVAQQKELVGMKAKADEVDGLIQKNSAAVKEMEKKIAVAEEEISTLRLTLDDQYSILDKLYRESQEQVATIKREVAEKEKTNSRLESEKQNLENKYDKELKPQITKLKDASNTNSALIDQLGEMKASLTTPNMGTTSENSMDGSYQKIR